MPTFPPDLEEALRTLQRQIDEINTARPGPTSYGPGDGHLRFYTSTGDTFHVSATGAQVKHRGALTGLTPHLEANTSKQEQQDGTLGQHSSRLDTLHSRQNTADQTNATQNGQISQLRADLTYESSRIDNRATVGQLNATNTRVTNVEARNTAQDGRIDTLHSRANSQDSLNATQNGQISQLRVDVDNAKARADNAHSDAATAKARADAAYSLASGKLDRAQVLALLRELGLIKVV